MTKAIEAYLASIETAPSEKINVLWLASFLIPFQELNLQHISLPGVIILKDAVSVLTRLARDKKTELEQFSVPLQAAFHVLLLFAQSTSMLLSGCQEDKLPEDGRQLLKDVHAATSKEGTAFTSKEGTSFASKEDTNHDSLASPPAWIEDDNSSVSAELQECRSSSQSKETAEVVAVATSIVKRRHTHTSSVDNPVEENANITNVACKEEEGAKRQRVSLSSWTMSSPLQPHYDANNSQTYFESNSETPVERTSARFDPSTFLRHVRPLVDESTDFDFGPFIEEWSMRLKRQAIVDAGLGANTQVDIKLDTSQPIPMANTQTKAGMARIRAIELKRYFVIADLNRLDKQVRWIKIAAIHRAWKAMDELCHEIQQVYRGVAISNRYGDVEEHDLNEAFERPALGYGKPLASLFKKSCFKSTARF